MANRHKFGQSTPPLVEYLKDILNRYPDGGQILKELIQNAEDAGAREVRFLYDKTQHGTQTLHSPKLAPYQGPALYAYNNAHFTDEDWDNIQMTARSVKKDDPMKIGRFGIGFNSVYHLTDLPMILSGHHVAILDPHEDIFLIDGRRESGCIWHLQEDAEEIKRLQDQFSPFKNIFEGAEDPFKTGFFKGTIFRFPLRQAPSRLSKTVYDSSKIIDLFESFEEDGDIALLFLHNVRSIRLMTSEVTGDSTIDYKVCMNNKTEQGEVRFTTKVQKALTVPLDNRETVVSTCRFKVVIDESSTRDWLVTNYVQGSGMSEEARTLSEELNLLPWMGVAMPLSGDNRLEGRTFCCLPLPAGHESTGLPVHVHGFFGVSDNRRSLKWTGTDQKSDSAARWNEVLVREILPYAYTHLITDATKDCRGDSLYAALPNIHHTKPHWDKVLKPFFNDVLNKKVVWTHAKDGRWITPRDAVFNRMTGPDDVRHEVSDYLVRAGSNVVTLPEHVMQAIDDRFSRSSLHEVTPGLLRITIKSKGVKDSNREQKLLYLKYTLQDKKYGDMVGIELLPLADIDKTFTAFSSSTEAIFIEAKDHPRGLLPGLQGRFLDPDIDSDILQHLQKAATEAEQTAHNSHPCLQLRHLTPQLVAKNLRKALPPDWLEVSHVTWYPARAQQPPREWLVQLWQYLQDYFPNDLSPFIGLPILPIVGNQATSLVRLEKPSKVICPSYGQTNVPDVIKKLVRDVDGIVLENVPSYLNHPKLEEFIHRCTPSGLLQLLLTVETDKVVSKVNALSAQAKETLCGFLAKAESFQDTERRLLVRLPIYETVNDTGLRPSFSAAVDSGMKSLQLLPDLTSDPLPVGLPFPSTFIIMTDHGSHALALRVGLTQLSRTQLLTGMMDEVRRGGYTREQTDSLMLWILERLPSLRAEDQKIINEIQNLSFVTTTNNTTEPPSKLFSPDESVSDVLLGEPVFPGPLYSDTKTALLQLGMRRNISANDILRSAKDVQTIGSGKLTLTDTKRKALAVMSVLNDEMLMTRIDGVLLRDALLDINFLPVCSERPKTYMSGLSWHSEANSAKFVSPRDARGLECAELVGATMPIVNGVSHDFVIDFGWSEAELPIEKVVGQLKTLCAHYTASQRPAKHQVVQMLHALYQHINARLVAGETRVLQFLPSPSFSWIWQGDGFAPPHTVALSSSFTEDGLILAPYRFTLPDEFLDFEYMFKQAGVKDNFDATDLIQTLHEIQSESKLSAKGDLKLSVDILEWLVSHPKIMKGVRDDILVPIATNDGSRLTLAPLSECTYCDVFWSDAQDILDDEDEHLKPIHQQVPSATAELLQVPSLSQRFVDAEGFGFDQCGQHEKVTQRLKNILDDYPEGAGIFKELVQNADDAGATEVKFLVDWRANDDSREGLIDPGMAVCHGPALWAFNNAMFSDEDFKNIQNLGGQTKLEATEKVGRFGVGFNSVYHVTDVPSFVSGSRVVFFDPHCTHLSKHIKDKSRPGIGLDFQKNTKLTRFKNQFKPFQGIFGYNLQAFYKGTLFRLPLRTPLEAAESEISDAVYSTPGNPNMKRLIESFKEGLKPLLLFTQNVRDVTMYTLDKNKADPLSMVEMLHVSKSPLQYLRELQPPLATHNLRDRFQIQSNCLRATSVVMRGQGITQYPETSMVVNVTCRENAKVTANEEWIVSSCMGTSTSLTLARSEKGRKAGLVPCGGVAALKPDEHAHQNDSVDTPQNGEVFCFLPLSIRTGLPVHVNGGFAVASNRRGLWEETSTDKEDLKVKWNKALMEDAVCKAYVIMLQDLSIMAEKGQLTPYQYHSFWPNVLHVSKTTPYSVLLQAFYKALSSGHQGSVPPPLFESEGRWLSFTSTVFLDTGITFSSDEETAARSVLQQCLSPNYTVVDLPVWAREGFKVASCGDQLSQHTYTEERFYSEVFFPRIQKLSDDVRDALVLRLMGRGNKLYNKLMAETACIPTSPKGETLSRPRDLIHPEGKVSGMFLPEDQKFPHGSTDTYRKPSRLEVLTELGMCKDYVPWEVVIERARSVLRLNESNGNECRKRIIALLNFIAEKAKKETKKTKKEMEQAQQQLSNIQFLPIMQKPREWPFGWKRSEYPVNALLSAHDLQPSENYEIAGASCPILCSDIVVKGEKHTRHHKVPYDAKKFLCLKDKSPDVNETMRNLQAIIAVSLKTLPKESLDCTRQSYLKTCQHLQMLSQKSTHNANEIATKLCVTPFILSLRDKKFLKPSDVSFDLKFDGAPYLYRVPDELATVVRHLLEVSKVMPAFGACDFIRALDHLKKDQGNQKLSPAEINLALELLKAASDSNAAAIRNGNIWIPDESGMLRRPTEVCYNDCAWMKQKDDMVFCHKDIPRGLAVDKLGVKPIRHKALEAYAHNLSCFGTDFGQVEKLTNRIKHLLDAYPFGKEILKELLQNADDAGATEVHFVFDKRKHGTKHIFDDSWKELQGPALCVYNNKPFTEEDLIGIQSLGQGSKAQDPVKTGKYGVGFNAVYHLTDCPSFMTGGDTLCIFDPQLRFVPGARQECPGRMYRDIDGYFREQYKDVFDCYLSHLPAFSSSENTMFRFPLRTATMAATSELSDKEVTDQVVMSLLHKFKRESFEVLLFLNSIEKIKISIVDRDGEMREFYHAEAVISDQAKQDRQRFADYVTQCARSTEPLHAMETHHVTYDLVLRDHSQHQETWIVHQRIGFEDKDIPNSIKQAHAGKELGLLPRGGAAVCYRSCKQRHQTRIDCYHMGPTRAFCFLPLPIETKLPFHINGHFALDHEARRGLWRDESGGMKTDWNNTLIREVIAPAYAAVLDAKRRAEFGAETQSVSVSNAEKFHKSLKSYHRLFPSVTDTAGEWRELSVAFYQHVDRSHLHLLPVLRTTDDYFNPQSSQSQSLSTLQTTLEWLPSTGDGKEEAFFNTLKLDDPITPVSYTYTHSVELTRNLHQKSKRQVLMETLLALGFNLLASPIGIFHAFRKAKVEVKEVMPESVIHFLQTHDDDDPLCRLRASLPAQLDKTTFKEPEKLQRVLEYCLSSTLGENEEHKLHGLPLLLTADDTLRVFDLSHPVFATYYADLVPSVPELFVHSSCLSELQRQKTDRSVRSFGIGALSKLLPYVLDESTFLNEKAIKLNRFCMPPSQNWMYRLWKFFFDQVHANATEEKSAIQKIKGLFAKWAVLPACTMSYSPTIGQHGIFQGVPTLQPGDLYAVPLCKAHTVITLDHGYPSSQQKRVTEILRKLHCMELNTDCLRAPSYYSTPYTSPSTETSLQLARRFVSGLSDHVGVLRVLNFLLVEQGPIRTPLNATEATELLKYFEEEAEKLQRDPGNLYMLRSLPLYKTIHSKLISLPTDRHCHVLPTGIPTADMDEWMGRTGAVFLERNYKLEKIHKALGCSGITDAEVYMRYIFPHIDHLSDDAVIAHLQYIRKTLFESSDLEENTLRSLTVTLKRLRIIPSFGTRRPVCEFYDDNHPVFQEMVSEENFLPKIYRCGKEKQKWRLFFIDIGLIFTVTKPMFLQYARTVESSARVARNQDCKLARQSDVLVDHFFTMKNLTEGTFIKDVSTVRFIVPVPAGDALTKLHPQYEISGNSLPFICFRNSVPEDGQKLCWTSANLLSDTANPNNRPLRNWQDVCFRLGIQVEPTLDTVVAHAILLCKHLAPQKAGEVEVGANSPSSCHTLWGVMCKIYEFLSQLPPESLVETGLGNVPCIVVEEGRRLVRPQQIAVNLEQNHEIRPYLYGMPMELGLYHKLFVSLGAAEKPMPLQYAKVLEELHASSNGEALNPNEKKTTYWAVFGLFHRLASLSRMKFGEGRPSQIRNSEDSFQNVQSLYLPSRKTMLLKSTELVFDDAPQFTDRVKEGFNYHFLVHLNDCHLKDDERELISRLPSQLMPKNLSFLVEEQLCDDYEQMACAMGSSCSLEARLTSLFLSTDFRQAIVRISKHSRGESCDEKKVIDAVEKFVTSFRVCCKQQLTTRLVYKESQEQIKGSDGRSDCFIKDSTLYVTHIDATSEEYDSFLHKLMEVINDGLERPLVNLSPLMMVLNAKDPSDIQGKLDRAGISRYAGQQYGPPLPDLGTPIPEIYHHLLRSNPAHYFSQGDYVGFEVYDPDLESDSEDVKYTMTFLYAQVIKEVSTDTELNFGLSRKYVIDVGYIKTVSAADIYKFVRPSVPGQLVPYDGNNVDEEGISAAPPLQSLEDAMEEVTNILEEAWKLPEKEKKKVVRRLYLQWHPDKNPDNVELATEVCKHLQAEISRLEKGLPRKTKREGGSGRRNSDFGESTFSSFFRSWDSHARFHRHQRERFYEHYRDDDFSRWRTGSGQWVPPRSDGDGFPNPREAARWHRQATADLQAAKDSLSGPGTSFEWTCLMCHQAAEKALKAVQLGKSGRYEMIHQIGGMARVLEAKHGGTLTGVGDAAMELSSIGSYLGCDDVYLRARYPNLHPAPRVPHDVFTRQHAERALQLSQTVLYMTQSALM